MTFKKDNVVLGIMVAGYADRPFCYGESQMLKNILEGQLLYKNDVSRQKFMLFEELFQTEDVLSIRDGIADVLAKKAVKYDFHNEYETLSICVESAGEAYQATIHLQYADKNVTESFEQSRDELNDIMAYLTKCSEEFPVRF